MPQQSLSLSLSQQQRQVQIMAPQMLQSLEILQMPIMELRGVIQKEMETNPLIEDVVSAHEFTADTSTASELEVGQNFTRAVEDSLSGKNREAAEAGDISGTEGSDDEDNPFKVDPNHVESVSDRQDAPLDFDVDTLRPMSEETGDYFFENDQVPQYTSEDAERRQFMFDSFSQQISLQQFLIDQLDAENLPQDEHFIGEMIIGFLDSRGFLTATLEDLEIQTSYPKSKISRILALIRSFDPVGIATSGLVESLLRQLEELPQDSVSALAERILKEQQANLESGKIKQIAHSLGVGDDDVAASLSLIKSLKPYPAYGYDSAPPEYINPEVSVERGKDGIWRVVMDGDQLPVIRISKKYKDYLKTPNLARDTKSYISDKIRSGEMLIRSIEERQSTIRKIAEVIVEGQQEFFNSGISALKPMTMSVVAERLGIGETTVSRAVSNKYMKTPFGVFRIKDCFTHGIKTADGSSVSNKAIQDRIKSLIEQESPSDPLSDSKIVEILAAEGTNIARRTVVKYRNALKIPSSHARRKILK